MRSQATAFNQCMAPSSANGKEMIPVYQTKFVHSHGTGNCMNAAIASLLERKLEEVASIHPGDPQWWHLWKAWLKTQGYYLGVRSKLDPPPGYALMSVWTDRIFPAHHENAGERISHVCVCLDGVFVHDPYPSASDVRDLICYYEVTLLENINDDD